MFSVINVPEIIERPPFNGDWTVSDGISNPHRIHDGIVFIRLTMGEIGVCDLDDLPLIRGIRWMACGQRRPGLSYMKGWGVENDKSILLLCHRMLTNCPPDMVVDHVNRDSLDNRRINMRKCLQSENVINSKVNANNTSGFRGVDWLSRHGYWRSRIRSNGVKMSLGAFATPEDAARAYDRKAIELHGEFAMLNFPRSDYEIAQPAIIAAHS